MFAAWGLTAPAAVAGPARAAALEAGLARLTSDAPGCALGIYEGGELVAHGAVGVAVTGGGALGPDTSFRIASTSKQFTAASVLLLAADGVVDLDDPVARWIPELAHGEPMTLRQLVHHTSGARDYLVVAALSGVEEPYGIDVAISVLARQRAGNFPPGTAFAYSNSGYLLLGEVVARASGSSLRAFADARLFGPLGMASTRFLDDVSEVWPTRARGYEVRASGRVIDADTRSNLVGDGGVYTSLTDLAAWIAHLRDDRLGVRDAQLAAHTLPDGQESPYLAGLVRGELDGLPMISHAGAYGGFVADLALFPEQDVAFACLCNREDGRPTARIAAAARVLLAETLASRPVQTGSIDPLPDAVLRPYVGEYVLAPGVSLAIRAEQGRAVVQVTGQSAAPLEHLGEHRFGLSAVGLTLTFVGVEGGEASAVRLQQRGVDEVLPRARPLPPAGDHAELDGWWWSEELGLAARVKVRGDAFTARTRVGTFKAQRSDADAFSAADGFTFRVLRDSDGAASHLELDFERATGMRFTRR